eukprot:2495198-Rhodomonas_salina.1
MVRLAALPVPDPSTLDSSVPGPYVNGPTTLGPNGERVVESGSLSWRAVHGVVHGRGELFTESVPARQACMDFKVHTSLTFRKTSASGWA